jgi:hypothetical protein
MRCHFGAAHRCRRVGLSDKGHPEDLKRLPLDGWHRARGARMVPFAGYEMPALPFHFWGIYDD